MTVDHWVFLHGTPLTPEVWRPIADRFRDESTAVACPSLDLRGDSAAHAARIVAGLPRNARLHIVGHSFGGQVATDIALLLGADVRLASLGVVCSRATPFPPFAATAQALRGGQTPDAAAALDRWFTEEERREGSPVIEYGRRRLRDVDPAVWADALDSIAHFDREDELASITVPVVLIAAEGDSVSTPETMRAMALRLPRGRFHLLQGTSHLGPFLRPDAIVSLLRAGVPD
jgi:pimeloyl-ACP methyl ester carboxylesterase